jgi:uncharacterized membrane protein
MPLKYPRYAKSNKTKYRLTRRLIGLVALIPIERLIFHLAPSIHLRLIHALHRLVGHFFVVVIIIALVVFRLVVITFLVALFFIVVRVCSHIFNLVLVDGLARRDDDVPVCALELLRRTLTIFTSSFGMAVRHSVELCCEQ